VHTLVGSAVASVLFLGGWDGPFAPGLHWMVLKTLALFVLVYWVRWSLLRFRSDQLMALCWRRLTPIGVALVLAAAAWVQFVPAAWGGQ
jgi:NADH-quinone oxidoreductase subunit H